ncbi:glycogenin-1-like isoform X1 [Diadema antillarum]|uniref:glycogenin-1-like isoform X1 n=1 Tax=Diadema antillarum TaxID=105358 RepID=UPI003A84A329
MASKVEDQAFVTLVTNDKYAYGALVVGQSLRDVGTTRQLAILVTPQVTQPMRRQLSFMFDYIHEVNPLDSNDEAHLALLTRPELGITFSKIYCWQLTQYSKCVFLDADTLILQNVDDLFDREELSAVADAGWPDCFNSGVFVFRPSNETYRGLLQCAVTQGSFDGGDQGLLNTFFSGWATSDISRHIPFVYNMTSSTSYSYLPAFVRFGNDVKIVHFIGRTKPWMFRYNTQTRVLSPPPDSSVAHDFKYVQAWWNIFLTKVMPRIEQEQQDTVMAATPYPDSKLHPLRELHEPIGLEQGPAMVPTTPQSTTQPLIGGGQHDPDQQLELVSAPLHESHLHPQGDMESSEARAQDTVMATTPLPDSKLHPLRELHEPLGPEQGPEMVPTTPQSTTQPLIGGGQHDPDQQVELVSAPLHESHLHPQGDMESSEARAVCSKPSFLSSVFIPFFLPLTFITDILL